MHRAGQELRQRQGQGGAGLCSLTSLPSSLQQQNEENGARGADQYRDNRDDEIATTSFALESDSGIFAYGVAKAEPLVNDSHTHVPCLVSCDRGQAHLDWLQRHGRRVPDDGRHRRPLPDRHRRRQRHARYVSTSLPTTDTSKPVLRRPSPAPPHPPALITPRIRVCARWQVAAVWTSSRCAMLAFRVRA